jgi:predicted AlkP superfamily phosphohydrolase/phosphomutase
MPYCDLRQAPAAQGLINWGAHDPGADHIARPAGLDAEMKKMFGCYPASSSIYGFGWPSAERTKKLGDELARAAALRAKAARWMFAEKIPDWRLAMVVVSESHSGTEALWHGIDPQHPLHGLPSAMAAREGLEKIYRAIDALVGELADAFPDAHILLFSMHGMGRNEADVAAMSLLPELMYRHSFGKPYARNISWSGTLKDGTPLLGEKENWDEAMKAVIPEAKKTAWKKIFSLGKEDNSGGMSMDWMPAARYRSLWPEMRAFALPSFYDGRILINLQGREASGMVSPAVYDSTCEEICDLLRECRNALTGEAVTHEVVRARKSPLQLGASDADISVVFQGAPIGLSHPRLGTIGPFPWRRTGGHTGESGFLYLSGSGIAAGDHGTRSSFDVVPTVIDLVGGKDGAASGSSILKTGSLERRRVPG